MGRGATQLTNIPGNILCYFTWYIVDARMTLLLWEYDKTYGKTGSINLKVPLEGIWIMDGYLRCQEYRKLLWWARGRIYSTYKCWGLLQLVHQGGAIRVNQGKNYIMHKMQTSSRLLARVLTEPLVRLLRNKYLGSPWSIQCESQMLIRIANFYWHFVGHLLLIEFQV